MAGVDRVTGLAADDDVVGVARGDGVAAAQRGLDRPHTVDVGRAHAVVGHAHGAVAAHEGFQRRIGPCTLQQFFAEVVDQAVVAEDDVVAIARRRTRCAVQADAGEGVDDVVASAAEHDVAPDAGGDRVAAADLACRHHRGDEGVGQWPIGRVACCTSDLVHVALAADQVVVQHQQAPVVAEDHVVAPAAVQQVATRTAHDDVVVAAAVDGVCRAVGERDADDLADRHLMHAELHQRVVGARRRHLAGIAEDDVLAVAGVDRVTGLAPEHDVVGIARGDAVAAAHGRGDRPDAVDVDRAQRVAGSLALQDFLGQVVDQAVVAEDDVVAVGCGRRRVGRGIAGCRGHQAAGETVDEVVATATEDHVAADAGGEGVVAVAELIARAVDRAGIDRRHQAQHLDLVVVVGLVGQRVADRAVGQRGHHAVDPEDAAMVAEDDVLAAAGVDAVAALAAEDDVVGKLVGDDIGLAERGCGVDAFHHVERDEVGVCAAEVIR